jgi:hypothetical protein
MAWEASMSGLVLRKEISRVRSCGSVRRKSMFAHSTSVSLRAASEGIIASALWDIKNARELLQAEATPRYQQLAQ